MADRIDKWLWSVRIFKTRSKATEACKAGHVHVGDKKVKASFPPTEGQIVMVKKNGFNFQYRILTIIQKRVGAPIAVTCYEDITPAEELQKFKLWFSVANNKNEFREKGVGRPTKKDRREIDEFKEWD